MPTFFGSFVPFVEHSSCQNFGLRSVAAFARMRALRGAYALACDTLPRGVGVVTQADPLAGGRRESRARESRGRREPPGRSESRLAGSLGLRAVAGGVGPSNTATQCKSLVFQSTILAIRVRGTESSAPIGPSNQPHTNMETSTIKGDTLSDRPSAFGSMMFPIIILNTISPPATTPARPRP